MYSYKIIQSTFHYVVSYSENLLHQQSTLKSFKTVQQQRHTFTYLID